MPLNPNYSDFMIGESICGRDVIIDNTPCVYLWRKDEAEALCVDMNVPIGKPVEVIYVDGEISMPDLQGCIRIILDGAWQHESCFIKGVTGQMLQLAGNQALAEAINSNGNI